MAEGTWDKSFPALVEHSKAKGSDINTRVGGLGGNYDKLPSPHDDGKKGFFGPCYVGDSEELAQSVSAKQVRDSAVLLGVESGVANAYVVTMSIPSAAYVAGTKIMFVAGNTNTGTSTVNVDGLGIMPLKAASSVDIPADYIFENDVVEMVCGGAFFQITSVTAHDASAAQSAIDSEASAVAAASSAVAASDSESEAASSENVCLASSNYIGLWADQSGAHNVPTSVYHDGDYWMLSVDAADIAAIEPGVSSDWVVINVDKMPAGGTTGQLIVKSSDDDYDVEWGDGPRLYAIGSSGASKVVDSTDGDVQTVTITENTTMSFTGFTNGIPAAITLVIQNSGFIVTWNSQVKWANAEIADISETGRYRIMFMTEDGGATLDASGVLGVYA